MIEGEEILNSLYGILEESRSSDKVDAAVNFIANRGRRISLIEKINVVEARFPGQWRKQIYLPLVQNNILVRSTKDPSGRVTLKVATDGELNVNTTFDGPRALAQVDSAYDRFLYYNELKQRLEILKERIHTGMLDEFLVFSPEDVIHKIMGLSGELLGLIGIDPFSGETYRRFISQFDSSPPKLTGVGTVAEGVRKMFEGAITQAILKDDVAIGILPRDNQDSDIAVGMLIQSASKNQPEKTVTLNKARIIFHYPTSQETKTAQKKDSEESDEEKKRKSPT